MQQHRRPHARHLFWVVERADRDSTSTVGDIEYSSRRSRLGSHAHPGVAYDKSISGVWIDESREFGGPIGSVVGANQVLRVRFVTVFARPLYLDLDNTRAATGCQGLGL